MLGLDFLILDGSNKDDRVCKGIFLLFFVPN